MTMRFSSAAAHRPIELLVIQPTPFCNLDCSYCYLPHRSDRRRMALSTLELVAERILAAGWTAPEVTIIWHAGEPLVLPPDWYKEAFAIFEHYCPAHARVQHAFQTNATLLDERWLPLLRRADVRVGVSLDGPPDLHDRARTTRDGRGTFERTIEGVRMLRAASVPFHVITVLGLESLSRADDLIDFYLKEELSRVCFNIEEIEGAHRTSSLAAQGVETAFRDFLKRIIERLEELEGRLWIREIAAALATLALPPGTAERNPQVEPLTILSVDSEGGLSTFSPELLGTSAAEFAGFRFGSIHDGGPERLLAHEAFSRAHDQITRGVEACRAGCPWFRWCGGGAPANKYFETGSFAVSETVYCRLTKQVLLDVVLTAIENGRAAALAKAA
jgi:uncharacterized protein